MCMNNDPQDTHPHLMSCRKQNTHTTEFGCPMGHRVLMGMRDKDKWHRTRD